MPWSMFVVIDVTNDDGQRVRAAHWWTPTVPDNNRNVILFTLFSIERLQTGYYTRPVAVVAAAYSLKHVR